jgi:hypothetical protein
MSGASVPPAKLSIADRLRQRLRPRSRASSANPAPVSAQTSTSSASQSPGSPSTQILASSSPPSAGLVAANSPNAGASPQQATSHPSSSNNILEDALKRLSDSDRATLRQYLLTPNDVDLALEQAVDAAKEKQQCCLEERWRFTLAGQEFILKEKADKIVRWLNRFKGVGDVAAAADPVHAGLPWAGIRLLLEVRILSLKLTNLISQSIGCGI